MTFALSLGSRAATRWTLPVLALLAAMLALSPSVARAQTDLAAENEKLKAEVEKLTQQRDALAERVRDLNGEITKLRNELVKLQKGAGAPAAPGGSPGATPSSTPPITGAVGKDPYASPDALLATLQSEYQEKFGSMDRSTRSEISRYQREVAGWTRSVQREKRAPVEWTITLVDPNAASDRPAKLAFQVIDPASGQTISEAASVLLPSRWSRDIAAGKAGDKWKISATLSASPVFNAQRETGGTPDEPRLIGPFAEFGFELAITQMAPAP